MENLKKNFAVTILILGLVTFLFWGCARDQSTLRIGCKNFTEQLILGEIVFQYLQKTTPEIPLTKKWGFGSTPLIHQALSSGEIDLYLEYTGTAEQLILKSPHPLSLPEIDQAYQKQFQARWLSPLGFSNGYVLVTRTSQSLPKKLSEWKSSSSTLKAGFNAEFVHRPDGFPLLQKNYGLSFKSIVNLDVGLLYPALEANQVDLISGFATDSRLSLSDYQMIEDDLQISPRYEPAPVVRSSALASYPTLEKTLRQLSGILNERTMQELNARVEIHKKSPEQVAREFWGKQNTN